MKNLNERFKELAGIKPLYEQDQGSFRISNTDVPIDKKDALEFMNRDFEKLVADLGGTYEIMSDNTNMANVKFEDYGEEAWFEYDLRRKTLIPARMHRPEDTETEQLYDRLNSELDKIRKEYLSMFPNENLEKQPQTIDFLSKISELDGLFGDVFKSIRNTNEFSQYYDKNENQIARVGSIISIIKGELEDKFDETPEDEKIDRNLGIGDYGPGGPKDRFPKWDDYQ